MGRRAVLALAAACILGVGGAAYATHRLQDSPSTAAHPPTLYPASALPVATRDLSAVLRRADADAGRWIAAHPTAGEAEFAAWASTQVPRPPSGAAQQAELRILHALPARTPLGDAAARWAEAQGSKGIWKLEAKQAAQLAPVSEGRHLKRVVKVSLGLGKTLQAQLKDTFARPSPYVTDPTLHALNQDRFARKFSYPSKHAIMATAAATVLDRLAPLRRAEVDRMLGEVLYSRLYARGHYPSDLAAGERLGRLIADFELHTVR